VGFSGGVLYSYVTYAERAGAQKKAAPAPAATAPKEAEAGGEGVGDSEAGEGGRLLAGDANNTGGAAAQQQDSEFTADRSPRDVRHR